MTEDQKRILEHAQQLQEQASKLVDLSEVDTRMQHQINGLYLIANANNASITGLIVGVVELTKNVAELRSIVNDYIRAVRNGKAGSN